jgi:hypothetical protein
LGNGSGTLLEVIDAPEVLILANGAQVDASNAKVVGAQLGIPAVKTPEVKIGGAVAQPARLAWVVSVD